MIFDMFHSGISVLHFQELDSTNAYAVSRLGQLPHHSLIISDIQTAGRGRQQRHWDSSVQGNLYMTLVEKQVPQHLNPANFTQLMAVSVRSAGLDAGYDLRIKWPNDLMLKGGKVGGILSEARFRGQKFAGLVIGLGVNLKEAPVLQSDTPYAAVSFADSGDESGTAQPPERDEFAASVIRHYMERYENFLESGFRAIAGEYRAGLSEYRRPVFIESDGFCKEHRFEEVNDAGEIVVRSPEGQLLTIQAGDVH